MEKKSNQYHNKEKRLKDILSTQSGESPTVKYQPIEENLVKGENFEMIFDKDVATYLHFI